MSLTTTCREGLLLFQCVGHQLDAWFSEKLQCVFSKLDKSRLKLNYDKNPCGFLTWSLQFKTKMNLRSVFTVEQQRILQRYYENGMTNQSKNCFQLILQCAQETKLDFSVVRTWVGNKRRKMSSKSALESGGAPPGTAHTAPSVPPEAMVRNVISGNLTVPWITGCSRKRALQDRTQFSDRDLATLKKYWDNGMTSLGSVCREKIEAVAAELNVDCEIVRTWIGNRRRKYRLMGIEVPPPRGGPADFSDQSEFVSKSALNPGEETATEVGDDNDRNDEVSICLSEGSSQEETNEVLQNEEIHHKDDDRNPVSADNVKIEIIDDEESDMISNSEVDQMSSLLDYKNEEVRFIENELENHKQKYFELQTFTRSLILAIKSDDKEQQQALLSDLPPELEEMDFNHTSPEPDDTSFSLSSLSEKNASDSL
ncbi:highly divergent homeobox isoform X4 [Gallus gallus]|uniref:highly divergent homeobox isoform X4 n=1 Tax=Gallus gallus TaxID=9031 RepID=UPI001F0011AE|nr:highly divergent homeobox isoform X4 [Gallus gallus]